MIKMYYFQVKNSPVFLHAVKNEISIEARAHFFNDIMLEMQ